MLIPKEARSNFINFSFKNLKRQIFTNNSEEKTFKFSLVSMMFPDFTNEKIYSNAFKNLYEYMDIKNIIKRLQDIDKLKMILFDERQRNVFEILPKPGIGNQENNSYFSMETIKKSRATKYTRKSAHKLAFLLNGDPINQRMYDLIDPSLKKEFESVEISKLF